MQRFLRWCLRFLFIMHFGGRSSSMAQLGGDAQLTELRNRPVQPIIAVEKVPDLTQSATCSRVFGVLGTEQCYRASMKISAQSFPYGSSDEFMNALSALDEDNTLRRVWIHIKEIGLIDALVERIEKALDAFLSPRFWWIAVSETDVITLLDSSMGKPPRILDDEGSVHILLLRQRHEQERFLKRLSLVQYPYAPGEDICAQSQLLLGSCMRAGWGAQMRIYSRRVTAKRWAVFNIYDSFGNHPLEGTMYAHASVCPTVVNKRLCAFMPLTNCSVPDVITKVPGSLKNDGLAVRKQLFPKAIASRQFTSASPNGQPIENVNTASMDIIPQIPYHAAIEKRIPFDWCNQKLVPGIFIDGNYSHLKLTAPQGSPNLPYTYEVLISHGFILRPNAFYRSLIRERIHVFRYIENKRPFKVSEGCAAVHIRRGDRVYRGLNMEKFCGRISKVKIKNGFYCVDKITGMKTDCEADRGCLSLHPFGSLSLQDYLDRVSLLYNKTKNVFVMTDDGGWLNKEVLKISPEWNIYSIPARPLSRKSNSPNATMNGVDFLASLQVARQCEAFVGHFESAVAQLVFSAMCFQHGLTVGHCPPTCDIGRAY